MLTCIVNIGCCPPERSARIVPALSSTPIQHLSPFIATHTRTPRKSAPLHLLTSFFSAGHFYSFTLFFTLKPVTPVFATLTKRGWGTPPAPEKPSFPFWNGGRFSFLPCILCIRLFRRLTTLPPAPKMRSVHHHFTFAGQPSPATGL